MDSTHNPAELAAYLANKMLINGRFVAASAGRTFDVHNPAKGTLIAKVPFGEAADVDLAVTAAKTALPSWAALPVKERTRLLDRCKQLLVKHAEELARLVSLETGKALRTESRGEACSIPDILGYFAGLASELKGETIPFSPQMVAMTVREPIGVVGIIVPWNAPLFLMAVKAAPALAAGNTVVIKAAEEAPLGALRFAELLNNILPPGVLNLVTGFGPDCGAPLVRHPDVRKITFTGSVETGRIVYQTAAEKLIPVTLELGGKNPMIVMADADVDLAVAGAIAGMRFTRQGQSCSAASRIYVHETLHETFLEKLVSAVSRLVIGDPLDEKTDIGTIISRQQFNKIQRYIDIGQNSPHAKVHICGELPNQPALSDGLFMRPHIFTGLEQDNRLVREEIFGPVCCVLSFTNYDDVLRKANDSEYGLTATIWTTDLKTAFNAASKLEAGFIQINQNLVAQPPLSYGGTKLSGVGREMSLESMLEHFTNKKTILVNVSG